MQNQPTPNQPVTPAATTQKPKVDWQKMTKQQREDFKVEKRAEAIAKVKTGEFPKGVRIKIGDHTLTLHPSGVSEKGSVSYSLSPATLELGGKKLRVNKVSISVLNEADLTADFGTVEDGDILG